MNTVLVVILLIEKGRNLLCEDARKFRMHSSYCAFFPFILDVKFVGCTSRGHTGGRSHRISHPPSVVHAFIFLARRIQRFLSLVDRDVEFCLLTITIQSFSIPWAFLF